MVDLRRELVLMSDNPFEPSSRPVAERFVQLVDAMDRVNARYAICGAVAMGAHGVRRFTEDIDVLVAADDLERVVAELKPALRELGRVPGDGPAKQVRLRPGAAPDGLQVDVDLLVPVDAVEAWALATAVRAREFDRKFDLVSVEALVVMKLRAYASGPAMEVGLKHFVDVLRVLREVPVDVAELRRFLHAHPPLAAALETALATPAGPERV